MEHSNNILIIDDSKTFCIYLQKLLSKYGINSAYSTNAREGLELVSKLNPFLVILDLNMPELAGDEFMIKYSEKKLFGDREVFMVTSEILSPDKIFALKTLGISKVIPKPFDEAKFIQMISDILPASKAA